jgi:ubiquinone/menaquinone biosynthesis C-methylase UbiE
MQHEAESDDTQSRHEGDGRDGDADHHDHDRDHGHGHGHGHGHNHGHHRSDDFDWDTWADSLELDAMITNPIVHEVVRNRTPNVSWPSITNVLDIGCGPGAVAVALCRLAPAARITALDSSTALLNRVRQRAAESSLDHRIWTVAADLEGTLPTMPAADVVWASMVLHHVTDPVGILRRLATAMQPGGTLVMVEFGNTPTVLPAPDPLRVSGTWTRFQAATSASLTDRLGLDPVTVDWPTMLAEAGFTDITDEGVAAHHRAPLDDGARRWLEQHLLRGVAMAGERLSHDDGAAITALAGSIQTRDDLFVHAERRVLTASRP